MYPAFWSYQEKDKYKAKHVVAFCWGFEDAGSKPATSIGFIYYSNLPSRIKVIVQHIPNTFFGNNKNHLP